MLTVNFPFRRAVLALGLAGALAAPLAQAHEMATQEAPPLPAYSLLMGYHLPHLMRVIGPDMNEQKSKLGLTEAQKSEFKAVLAEVPPAITARFKEAQALEAEIGRAALLDGQTPEALAAKLDRLAVLKREAAEIHIRCVNRVKRILTPEQYRRVLEVAAGQAKL